MDAASATIAWRLGRATKSEGKHCDHFGPLG